MNELISVVVPVYNTSDRLGICIDSILQQTKIEFELLLMDDGSTDGSEVICDRYALADPRVFVCHLRNGGAAYARNKGLDKAVGDYVIFVDSDDVIPCNHLEILYDALRKTDADMAFGGIKYVPGPNISHKEQIFDTQGILEAVLYRDGVGDYPVSKLYRRKLFYNLRFQEGITSEDFEIFYELYKRASRVAVTDRTTYYYYQNAGSVSNGGFTEKFFNRIEICDRLLAQVAVEFPQILPAAQSRAVDEAIWLAGILPSNYRKQWVWIMETVRKYGDSVRRDARVTAKVKRKLIIFSISPRLWKLRTKAKNAVIRFSKKRIICKEV